jgi:hypothetical protein
MAEQFVMGFAVEPSALERIVGSRDDGLVARVLAHDLAGEVAGLIEESDGAVALPQVLAEIVQGRLDRSHAYCYRRALELLVRSIGSQLEPGEVTLPGRGWHEIGPAWQLWEQPTLAAIWDGDAKVGWPWRSGAPEVAWPIAALLSAPRRAALAAEIARFDVQTILKLGAPATIARFGDPEHWPPAALAEEIRGLVDALNRWLQALPAGCDLLVWHDGQQ